MRKVYTNRLLKLADHLDTVPRKHFRMRVWACGTVACAVGHACTIPSFKRAGLRLQGDTDRGEYECYPVLKQGGLVIAYDYEAAEWFFGLTLGEADYLFHPGYYPGDKIVTPKQVARRIRKFVADKENESRET